MKAQRDRRMNALVSSGACTEIVRRQYRAYIASVRRFYGALFFLKALTATVRRCHGDHCALKAILLRSSKIAVYSLYKTRMQINVLFTMDEERQQAVILLSCIQMQHVYDYSDMVHIILRRRRRRPKRRRRFWVRPWLDESRRIEHGHFHRLMPELRYEDPASYLNYLRVPPAMFDELLHRLRPRITKSDTRYRKALVPGLKLAMTLRHLASVDRYASMKFDFRAPHNTMPVCVREVCQAIIDEYKNERIQCPTTEVEWCEISAAFERRWNVPHACGALDGKHVACRRP
jgi:hypothetical protein